MFPLFLVTIEDLDDRAFMGQLFDRLYKSAYKQAWRYASSSADVEDIVEDSFLALMNCIDKLKQMDDNSVKAYVLATVKSVGLAYVQKSKRSPEPVDIQDYKNVEASIPDIDANLLLKCNINMLNEAIKRLAEVDKVILTMKYYLEMTDLSIAKKLGISHGAVRTRLTRVRKKLYEILMENLSYEEK